MVILAQMWDSRNAEGAGGVAEFLSARSLACRAWHCLAPRIHCSEPLATARTGTRAALQDAVALQQVLLALPALGFASGVALGAAAALDGRPRDARH